MAIVRDSGPLSTSNRPGTNGSENEGGQVEVVYPFDGPKRVGAVGSSAPAMRQLDQLDSAGFVRCYLAVARGTAEAAIV